MICRTCLRRVATAVLPRPQTNPSPQHTFRYLTTTVAQRSKAAAEAAVPESSDASAPKDTIAKTSNIPVSSCPAGTTLQGLNYIKGKTDPVALPDEEYPDWLWTCLKTNQAADVSATDETADEYSKSKKQRRAALRKKRNEEKRILETGDLSALEPKIPLTRQTINLPANEDGSVEGAIAAHEKRAELRSALRRERKAKIKETNYLKSM